MQGHDRADEGRGRATVHKMHMGVLLCFFLEAMLAVTWVLTLTFPLSRIYAATTDIFPAAINNFDNFGWFELSLNKFLYVDICAADNVDQCQQWFSSFASLYDVNYGE
eukprot:Gregarina_sp_Poly_1__7986@NODE_4573_length_553_cov_7_088477_g3086_i0_p1_GENE_NODE_4573_length_553_cov_7_088477_g3086_i0NODE_4573_length_553_cov_7_088477_g3086_i0_p1_ORF_typecomplete_len108_score8_90_NODE_4573_length_553_cov_7_088477_g3086_i0212535